MSLWYINRMMEALEEIKKGEGGKPFTLHLITEELVEQQKLNEGVF